MIFFQHQYYSIITGNLFSKPLNFFLALPITHSPKSSALFKCSVFTYFKISNVTSSFVDKNLEFLDRAYIPSI